jgi:uncharacterized protein YecE (DUF72 family)
VERFRYLYSEEELAEWLPRIREAAEEAREVHILMNNCYAQPITALSMCHRHSSRVHWRLRRSS